MRVNYDCYRIVGPRLYHDVVVALGPNMTYKFFSGPSEPDNSTKKADLLDRALVGLPKRVKDTDPLSWVRKLEIREMEWPVAKQVNDSTELLAVRHFTDEDDFEVAKLDGKGFSPWEDSSFDEYSIDEEVEAKKREMTEERSKQKSEERRRVEREKSQEEKLSTLKQLIDILPNLLDLQGENSQEEDLETLGQIANILQDLLPLQDLQGKGEQMHDANHPTAAKEMTTQEEFDKLQHEYSRLTGVLQQMIEKEATKAERQVVADERHRVNNRMNEIKPDWADPPVGVSLQNQYDNPKMVDEMDS